MNGSVGTQRFYGFFKYNDESVNIDDTKGVERELEIFANDVSLEVGQFSNAIAPIAQGVNKFTKEAKTPLDKLTQAVSAFNSIPSYSVLDLRGKFISFVKAFDGNPRKGKSDVLVIELMDKDVVGIQGIRIIICSDDTNCHDSQGVCRQY